MAKQPVVSPLEVGIEAVGVEHADEERDGDDRRNRVENRKISPAHDAPLVGIGWEHFRVGAEGGLLWREGGLGHGEA